MEYLAPVSDVLVVDVRIGLGYTSVRLDNGNSGIAWTAHDRSEGCTHSENAGTLAGRPAGELLDMLLSPGKALSRTIGLATANALSVGISLPESTTVDILELVNIQADLLSKLGNPRATIILGPSSFMRPEIFHETPVTHIAGSRVLNGSGQLIKFARLVKKHGNQCANLCHMK